MKTPKINQATIEKAAKEHDAFAKELAPAVRTALETKTAFGVSAALLSLAAQVAFHDGMSIINFTKLAGGAYEEVIENHK